jgi:hypothetical protein
MAHSERQNAGKCTILGENRPVANTNVTSVPVLHFSNYHIYQIFATDKPIDFLVTPGEGVGGYRPGKRRPDLKRNGAHSHYARMTVIACKGDHKNRYR